MSLHVTSPEAQEAVRKQRKTQATSSTIIAFLALVLFLIALSAMFLVAPKADEIPAIAIYAQYHEHIRKTDRPIKETVKDKPQAASSAANRVIHTNVSSTVNIPIPEIEVEFLSEDFGLDGNFGDGSLGNFGQGRPPGKAKFFGATVNGERIVYVLDYSLSMRGMGKLQLLQDELIRSINSLEGKIDYQLIFFSGPGWVAGDDINLVKRGRSVITSRQPETDGEKYYWDSNGGTSSFFPNDQEGELYTPGWLKNTESQIKESTEHIREQKTTWGTVWEPHLEMAMRMDPKPNVIFFMTDGVVKGVDMQNSIARLVQEAKQHNIVINTVAMMEPKARDNMLKLAEDTGGVYTMIDQDGKPYDKNGDPTEE